MNLREQMGKYKKDVMSFIQVDPFNLNKSDILIWMPSSTFVTKNVLHKAVLNVGEPELLRLWPLSWRPPLQS